MKRRRTETVAAGTADAASTRPSAANSDGGTDKKRDRRDRLDMCVSHDKDLQTKKGNIGRTVCLTAIYFRVLRKPEWELHQYRVDFNPHVEILVLRKRLMHEQKPLLGGFLYDSNNMLFLSQKLPKDVHEVTTKHRDGNEIQITLKWVKVVEMPTRESLQVLNIIVRRAMDGLKLQLVGRNLFDAKAKVSIFKCLL